MKPTKKQKLQWIKRVLRIGEKAYIGYTCHAFGCISYRAESWYCDLMRSFSAGGSYAFEGFWTYHEEGNQHSERNQARILWLSFLHHWVSTGEVK